jgi:hypothetical protein
MARRLLFLLVAALLLRGWVGEAMAGQMLAQQLHLPSAHAASMHSPDCPGAVADDQDLDAAASASLHCQGCTLHALTAAPLPQARPLPPAPPQALSLAFASAEPQPGLKPPIS